MAGKVTTMEITTDLQCYRCYKKIKKVLCKFPEIRDQKYDDKNNKVTITVVSCCPEKIKQKIYCKGGKCIKSIEIKIPPPPPPPADKKPDPPPEKKKPDPPPPDKKPPDPKPVPDPCPPPQIYVVGWPLFCTKCHKGSPGGPCSCGQRSPPPICCRECSLGGPCSRGKYRPPPPCYCDYICEENPYACTIM